VMNIPQELIGVTFCCLIPMIWTALVFAFGLYYERNGGLPWELRRRRPPDEIDMGED
jgi:hypothetical protein